MKLYLFELEYRYFQPLDIHIRRAWPQMMERRSRRYVGKANRWMWGFARSPRRPSH